MEIKPATLDTLSRLRDGTQVIVPNDVANVAADLKAISPSLRLEYNEYAGRYVVVQVLEDGKQHLVTTAEDCDQRLVNRVRKITDPSYDLLAEMDKLEAQAKRDEAHASLERNGEVGERLLHGMRRDLQLQNTVFMGDRVKDRRTRGKGN